MKIFVVSDTHGRIKDFVNTAKSLERPDLIIHLGDYVEDALKIEEEMGIDTIVVKGNCDIYSTGFDEDKIINLNNKKILITHGHKYNVKMDISRLVYKGMEEEVDLILFGHTHFPQLEEQDGIIIMNPGSVSLPRLFNSKTFGIIELGEKISGKIVKVK
ncbi:MAG TPA: metallophosphoesterase [Tissierellales bacterium]|nr:metallophosphoesterase [Tissierellales bacterium]